MRKPDCWLLVLRPREDVKQGCGIKVCEQLWAVQQAARNASFDCRGRKSKQTTKASWKVKIELSTGKATLMR
jgi:hypothetical protein